MRERDGGGGLLPDLRRAADEGRGGGEQEPSLFALAREGDGGRRGGREEERERERDAPVTERGEEEEEERERERERGEVEEEDEEVVVVGHVGPTCQRRPRGARRCARSRWAGSVVGRATRDASRRFASRRVAW